MSVTLRDAQHVCWKTFRKISGKLELEESHKKLFDTVVSGLRRETSAIISTIDVLKSPKPNEQEDLKKDLGSKLSEILYSVFVLAEYHGIALEEVFLEALNEKAISSLT